MSKTENPVLDRPLIQRDTSPVTIPHIIQLEEHLQEVIEKVRNSGHIPSGTKVAPTFNATALAKLCGRSLVAMMRLLDRATDYGCSTGLPESIEGDTQKAKRSFSQAQVVEWVRAVNPPYKRAIGVPGAAITIGNFKGGVGKTIIATSLAQGLSLMGYRVLCIDLDPQGSMSSLFDIDREGVLDEQTFLPLTLPLQSDEHRDTLQESIQETYWSGIDLVAGSTSLFSGEFHLPMRQMACLNKDSLEPGFRFMEVLDRALDNGLRDEYDYIIIDTPPALSYITMNAYWAADGILMPLPAEGLDIVSSGRFWSMFSDLASSFAKTSTKEKTYSWIAAVPSKVDHTKSTTKDVLTIMQVAYSGYLISNCEIPLSSAVSVGGVTLSTVYDMTKYVGAQKTYERARFAFDRLAQEVDHLTRRKKWQQTPEEMQSAMGREQL